jgi:hypothetical protein
MERLAGGTSSDAVLRYLEGIPFPALKHDLVHAVRQRGAPADVVAAVGQLPQTEFADVQQVLDAYPKMA